MGKIIKPPGTSLCPVPCVMVSCAMPGRRPNIITLAWVGTVCSDPPMVGVGIRPARYSYEMIKAAGEFAINIPNRSLLSAADYCGVVSGRDADKFAVLGLTETPARFIKAPLIGECPINLEVRVAQIVPLGSHDLFLGEILAVHVDESILNRNGRIDPAKMEAFVYGSSTYWEVGGALGLHGFSNGEPAKARRHA